MIYLGSFRFGLHHLSILLDSSYWAGQIGYKFTEIGNQIIMNFNSEYNSNFMFYQDNGDQLIHKSKLYYKNNTSILEAHEGNQSKYLTPCIIAFFNITPNPEQTRA